MLVGSRAPLRHDLARIRARMGEEPFRTALEDVWRTERLEGLFARFVAGPAFAARLQALAPPLNTDDRNALEFGFARSLGVEGLLDVEAVRRAAAEAGADHPAFTGGTLDLARLLDERLGIFSSVGEAPPPPKGAPGLLRRADAHALWTRRSRPAAAGRRGQDDSRRARTTRPRGRGHRDAGEGDARRRGRYQPAGPTPAWPGCACQGWLGVPALESAWPARTRGLAPRVRGPRRRPGLRPEAWLPRVLDSLRPEFALRMLNEVRVEEAFLIGSLGEPGEDCARLLDPVEPNVPFTRPWLDYRFRCYARTDDPRLVAAWDDLRRFEARGPQPLVPPPDQSDDPVRQAHPLSAPP
jgi:hypothetical protein